VNDTDFDAVVRSFVADELGRRLAPFRGLLARLEKAKAAVAMPRGPGRPRRSHLEAAAAIVTGRAAPHAARAHRAFKPGDVVHYRQGRGSFEAFVIRAEAKGRLVVERVSDGKRVVRPTAKLF
jgi:hypothetical protein